jgi:hypothetical protein
MSRLNPMAFLIPYDTNPGVLAEAKDDLALDL